MNVPSTRISRLALVLLCLGTINANATTLTFGFEGVPSDFFAFGIPEDYGDRVTNEFVEDGAFGFDYLYEEGQGFTPNVTVASGGEFAPLVFPFSTVGDLNSVVTSQGSLTGEGAFVTLIPDPGYTVTLLGWDMACAGPGSSGIDGFCSSETSIGFNNFSAVEVLVGGEVVLDLIAEAGGDLLISTETHTTFEVGITSDLPISIRWVDGSGLALDNIRFVQTAAVVPVPAGGILLVSGLLALIRVSGIRAAS